MNDEHLRYPTGRFQAPERKPELRLKYVSAIGEFPAAFRHAAETLQDAGRLDERYRPGGWTARQVIHHVMDSHTNAYVRHKRILTEDVPTLTPYAEGLWARLPDVDLIPIRISLDGLDALHARWSVLLTQCGPAEWDRRGIHGGSGATYHLDTLAAHYTWHGRHHLAHLQLILDAQSPVGATG